MNNKYLLLLSYCISILISSCSYEKEESPPPKELNDYNQEVIGYFKEIALGFENNDSIKVTRKWQTTMKVFVDGDYSTDLLIKVEETIDDINAMATDGFLIELVSDNRQSNCYVYFGKRKDFVELFLDSVDQMESNHPIFNV